MSEHPGVHVTLHEGFSSELVDLLLDGQLDVAVITRPTHAPTTAGVMLKKIVDDSMLVAMPADHRYASRRRLRLADLVDENWIAGDSRAEVTLLRPLVQSGFAPRIGFVAKDWVAKQGFVAAGIGITLVPSLAASAMRSDIALVALDRRDLPPRAVYAATHTDVTQSPATSAFIDVLTRFSTADQRHR